MAETTRSGVSAARERFQHLALGQERIGQRGRDGLRLTLGEDCAHCASRPALGEREFLADRKLRNFRDQCFFSEPPHFRLRGGGERETHQIERRRAGAPWSCDLTRRVRMRGQAKRTASDASHFF